MTTVRPRRLGHVGITTPDLERLVSFYADVLGLIVSDRMPYPDDSPFHEAVWMRCNSDHHVITLFGLRDPAPAPAPARSLTGRLHHIAFELASFDDLLRSVRMARELDLPVQGTRTGGPGCQLRLYVWDPDDNLVELYWGLDQVGWDGVSRPWPEVTPIDLETLDIDAWLDWKGPEFKPGAPVPDGARHE